MASNDHHISLTDAIALTTRARNAQLLSVHAWQFDRTAIDQLLAQEGVSGIRMYIGLSVENVPNLILVGTNSDNQDMTSGYLAEYGLPCPPFCDDGSVLLTGL
jgi:hypothetical protein